jgi:hypothetical protein
MSKIEVAFPADVQGRILSGLQDNSFSRIKLEDLITRGVDDPMLKALQKRLPPGAWVAGGCFESLIRGEKPKDYDIFFQNEEAFMETLQRLTVRKDVSGQFEEEDEVQEPATQYKVSNVNPEKMRTSSCRFVDLHREGCPKVQLIKTMWYPSLAHVLHSFDFTAAQIGMDKEGVVLNPLAVLDISRKRLVLSRMTFPSSTLRRMIKYTQKGYYACPGSLQVIAQATADTLQKAPDAVGPVYVD